MRFTAVGICASLGVCLSGCYSTTPKASANLAEVIQKVRADLKAAALAPGENPATALTMSEAQVILKINAEGGSGINLGSESTSIPLKVTYSATQSGSLENTITIKYSLAGTPGNPGGGSPLIDRPNR